MINLNNSVLNLLFKSPEKEYYVREIIKLTGASPKKIIKEINELMQYNIINTKKTANIKRVFLNNTELVKTLKKLWIFSILTNWSQKINAANIVKILLYGSFANQSYSSKSDIDLLYITETGKKINLETIPDLENQIAKEASVIAIPEKDYYNRFRKKDKFIKNIEDNNIVIWESEHNEL